MNRVREAIVWWEKRRILFNLAVLATGLTTGLIIELIGSRLAKPGEDVEEPLGIVAGVIAFALAANACYTLGWIAEIIWSGGDIARTEAMRPKVFRVGIIFSVVVTLLPGILVPVAWAIWGFH
jgi:hypothetical protein